MEKFRQKAPLGFALVWIGVYVVGLSLADSVSESLGVAKSLTAPLCVVLSIWLFRWLKKEGLLCRFGLCAMEGSAREYLYFLPLGALVSVNLWWGVRLNMSAAETALYVISMLCVGFLEEIIFRGFLFDTMKKDSIPWAVAVSGVTFGLGHIVNLVNGAQVLPTLVQIVYAAAAGILFAVIFYKSGSLIPCILTHSAINALSAFSNEQAMTPMRQVVSGGFLAVVAIVYCLYLCRGRGKPSV